MHILKMLATLPLLLGVSWLSQCAPPMPSQTAARRVAFTWKAHPEYSLPASMRVYEGLAPQENAAPLRAWRVDIDWKNKNVTARAFLSNAKIGKETASAMARKIGAQVAINGGYFDMGSVPARTFSLVQHEGRVLSRNIQFVPRGALRFPVTRAAFGINDKRKLHINWIFHDGDSIYSLEKPAPHRTDLVAPTPLPASGKVWKMQEAIGAGPILLKNGNLVDSYENEVFWGSGFPRDEPYTRAAIGFNQNGRITIFATDGRLSTHTIGLTLRELSQTLRALGCTDAMNLDGGGSETLVVDGRAINNPSDGREREVTSVLGFSS